MKRGASEPVRMLLGNYPRSSAGATRASAIVGFVGPPQSEAELLLRARALSGRRLGDLASELGLAPPADLRHAKGFIGTLIERALGATASSRAEPDFQAIGVELKTLPVDRRGRPCESTFVCTIPLLEMADLEWEASPVWRKLRRVLWVPFRGERTIAPAERSLGEPLLWSPSAEEEADLRFDWEELSGIIGRGDVESLTGHVGRWLQVRPKARDSRARRRGTDTEGGVFRTLPRGFYLRAGFTARLLEAHYVLPAK
jgi:DNA mismatch repair protein MutH